MSRKRLKITATAFQGETGLLRPLGDPTGQWYGGDWLAAVADPLDEEILCFLFETHRLQEEPGYPQDGRFRDILAFIARCGESDERTRARTLRARLQRRDRRDLRVHLFDYELACLRARLHGSHEGEDD